MKSQKITMFSLFQIKAACSTHTHKKWNSKNHIGNISLNQFYLHIGWTHINTHQYIVYRLIPTIREGGRVDTLSTQYWLSLTAFVRRIQSDFGLWAMWERQVNISWYICPRWGAKRNWNLHFERHRELVPVIYCILLGNVFREITNT